MNYEVGGVKFNRDAERDTLNNIWFTSDGASAAYTLFWSLANLDEEKAVDWFRGTLDLLCKGENVRARSHFHFITSLLLEQLVIRKYHVDVYMTRRLMDVINEIEEKESHNWA